MYIKENTLGENYNKSNQIVEREEPSEENEYRSKSLFNQKNYILKAERIPAIEIDEIKENVRLKIGDITEDYTNRVNSCKMDTNVIEHQKKDKESNNTAFGKVYN
jgi:hypothetical protein